ncbi:MAG: PIN domain-containing protein [Thermoanaerobaculia bacterium]
MAERAFVDTNILVYAHDRGSGAKHERARAMVERLWRERSGVISTQVLQEFYVNVRRKARQPMPRSEAVRAVEDYLTWQVVINDGDSILEALRFEERFGLSFWDALIVQSAHAAGVVTLYSEDLQAGRRYAGVEVVDPLAEPTE